MQTMRRRRKSSALSAKRWRSLLTFTFKHFNFLRAMRAFARAKVPILLASLELGKRTYKDSDYAQRVEEFDQAMIDLTKAKWYMTRGIETRSKEKWKKGFASLNRSKMLGEKIYQALLGVDTQPISYEKSVLSSNGTEILFADGVPLVPEINPVVILQGSDYEMGYQYAQQLVHIFGPWILELKAGRKFTGEERNVMRNWEEQIRYYAPEILGMIEGWVSGANDAGVPMSYEDVLEIWTGHLRPAGSYLRLEEDVPAMPPPLLCSGAAAWGQATVDGRFVTGSSGDHDHTYTVTVVAFPKTGNNFIISPFGATGDVPFVGQTHMFGHPGMNNKGLAYVHHGGVARMIEPEKHWGYGVRRGTSIWHILRFANNAEAAKEMEMSYPIGDVGMDSVGTVGGFYVDNAYGYVLESRREPFALREAGMLGETDFLYANNSALHPEANKAGWMQRNGKEWIWEKHRGWFPACWVPFTRARRIEDRMGFMYWGSSRRNQYLFDMLSSGAGKIDLEYMKMIYRKSGTLPPGTWEEISKRYNKNGNWGKISTGNATNALVGVMKPDNGDTGLYLLSVGPARRGLTPNASFWAGFNPIYAETNAFMELTLASGPEGMGACAKKKAQEYVTTATAELSKLDAADVAFVPLSTLLNKAQSELESGSAYASSAGRADRRLAIFDWARAIRAYTRAQVRAKQVINALVPPPDSPDMLGVCDENEENSSITGSGRRNRCSSSAV